jgi:hypothetical protein
MENVAFEVRVDTLRYDECHGLAPWIVAIVAKDKFDVFITHQMPPARPMVDDVHCYSSGPIEQQMPRLVPWLVTSVTGGGDGCEREA